MIQKKMKINGIPAILWGEPSNHVFIAVHGNMSNKADTIIKIFAEEAVSKGYRVLSFDLPEHGERKAEETPCKVQFSVRDLIAIIEHAKTIAANISVFACSMGAYFSLLAYKDDSVKKSLFLSPILDMEQVIKNMMVWFDVTEDRLKEEKEIPTPIGQTLYWDYFDYVKSNPIKRWNIPTAILYGSEDNLTEYDTVSDFVRRFDCKLSVLDKGEHYFHTTEQLGFYKEWLRENI